MWNDVCFRIENCAAKVGLVVLLCLGAVAGVQHARNGWDESARAATVEAEPTSISYAQLAENGPPKNPHVDITDCRLGDGMARTFQDGTSNSAWLPLFPVTVDGQDQGAAIRVIARFDVLDEVTAEFVAETSRRGLLWSDAGVPCGVVAELLIHYPQFDREKCYVLHVTNQLPNPQAGTRRAWFGALVAGVCGLLVSGFVVAWLSEIGRLPFFGRQNAEKLDAHRRLTSRLAQVGFFGGMGAGCLGLVVAVGGMPAAIGISIAVLLTVFLFFRMRASEKQRERSAQAIAARLKTNSEVRLSLIPTATGFFVVDRGQTSGFMDTDLRGLRVDPSLRALQDCELTHEVVVDVRVDEAGYERVIRLHLDQDMAWRAKLMPFFGRAVQGLASRAWDQLQQGDEVRSANWKLTLTTLIWKQSQVEHSVQLDELNRIAWQGSDLCLWSGLATSPLTFFAGSADNTDLLACLLYRVLPDEFLDGIGEWLSLGPNPQTPEPPAKRRTSTRPVLAIRVSESDLKQSTDSVASAKRRPSRVVAMAAGLGDVKKSVPLPTAWQSTSVLEMETTTVTSSPEGSASPPMFDPYALASAEFNDAKLDLTAATTQEEGRADLGECVREWATLNKLMVVVASLCATIPVCGLLWILNLKLEASALAFIAVGASACLGFAAASVMPGGKDRLRQCRNGIFVNGGSKRVPMRYSDMTSLTANYVDHHVRGIYRSTILSLRFEGAGETIKFEIEHKHETLLEEQVQEFVEEASQHVAEHMRGQLKETGRVAWAQRLTFVTEGLEYRTAFSQIQIPFQDIRNIAFYDGKLEITYGAEGDVISDSTANANFFPGLALLRHILAL